MNPEHQIKLRTKDKEHVIIYHSHLHSEGLFSLLCVLFCGDSSALLYLLVHGSGGVSAPVPDGHQDLCEAIEAAPLRWLECC